MLNVKPYKINKSILIVITLKDLSSDRYRNDYIMNRVRPSQATKVVASVHSMANTRTLNESFLVLALNTNVLGVTVTLTPIGASMTAL